MKARSPLGSPAIACTGVSNTKFLAKALGATGAVAGAGGALAGLFALRRWERSELAREELTGLPNAEELRIRTHDDAELVAFDTRGLPDESDLADVTKRGTSARTLLFVLIHGWTNDSRVWSPLASRLVDAGHRVIVYDHRGHGASGIGREGLTLDALASDLMSVLDHFATRDAIVVGHSMGGMTAQALAVRDPDHFTRRVAAMVLVGTACGGVHRNRIAASIAGRVVAHPRLDRAMQVRTLGPFLVRRAIGKTACRTHLDAICEMFVGTSPEVRSGFLGAIGALDLAPALPNLRLPVTVVAGARDNLLPPHHSQKIAGLIQGSRLVEIAGVGHMIQIEAPDRLAEVVLEEARRVVGGQRRLPQDSDPITCHQVSDQLTFRQPATSQPATSQPATSPTTKQPVKQRKR